MAEACQQWIWHASLCWRRNTTDCRTGYFSTGWHDYENWLGSVLRFCISWAVIHPAVGMPHCKHVTVMVGWCVDLHGDEAFIREVMITKAQQHLQCGRKRLQHVCNSLFRVTRRSLPCGSSRLWLWWLVLFQLDTICQIIRRNNIIRLVKHCSWTKWEVHFSW